MSEQEFDLYLRLMSRLLKLNQDQERAIADELRDHMQERFTELVRAGLTREQAIERALMEFGDAASLAGEFSSLAAKRRRRFWGRLSLAGTGAAALVAVGLVSLWPAAKPENAPNQTLVAQDKKPELSDGSARTAAPLKIEAVDIVKSLPPELAQPAELQFPDNTLKEVADFLAQTHSIPILFDPAIADSGVNVEETKVRLTLTGPLHLALDRLCLAASTGTSLAWSYQDRILRITTAEASNEHRTTRSYDTSRLLRHNLKVSGIASLIVGATSGPWDVDEPGTATINPLGTQLVIRADERLHRQTAALIAALEGVLDGQADVLWSDEVASTLAAAELLERPTEVQFPDNTLAEVLNYLSGLHGQPILVHPSVEDAGTNPEEAKVSLTLAERPLRTIAELLLANVAGQALTLVPSRGSLWVMTVEAANELRTTAVYRVAEFEQAGVMDELIEAIHEATSGPWDKDEPGTGTLRQPHPHLLVIRQTYKVHRQIQKLIEEQRKSLPVITAEQRAAIEQRVETRVYRLEGEKEEDLVRIIRTTIDPEHWGEDEDPKAQHWIRRVRMDSSTTGGGGGFGGGMGGMGGGMGGGGLGVFQFGGGAAGPNPGGAALQQCAPASVTVLLVRHTRATHRRIDALLHSIRHAALYGATGGTMQSLTTFVPRYGVEFDSQIESQISAPKSGGQ